MKIRRLIASALLVVIATLPGCALLRNTPDVPPSTEGRIAQAGRQVVAAGESVLSGLDKLGESGVLTPKEVINAATVVRRVGTEGKRLSEVLRVASESRSEVERTKGLVQAASILKGIQRLVLEAGSGIGSETGRSRVASLLGDITDVVLEVAMWLPAPTQ